jgi:hypothetical protein
MAFSILISWSKPETPNLRAPEPKRVENPWENYLENPVDKPFPEFLTFFPVFSTKLFRQKSLLILGSSRRVFHFSTPFIITIPYI